MHPVDAQSPKWRIQDGTIRVVYTHPTTEWSLARMVYDDKPALGIRWNGDIHDRGSLGYPSARGNGAWFILPEPLAQMAEMMIGLTAGHHASIVVPVPPTAFEMMKAGLDDAIAFAEGDTSRGRIVHPV